MTKKQDFTTGVQSAAFDKNLCSCAHVIKM